MSTTMSMLTAQSSSKRSRWILSSRNPDGYADRLSGAGSGRRHVTFSIELDIKADFEAHFNFSVWDSVDQESVGMGSDYVETTTNGRFI